MGTVTVEAMFQTQTDKAICVLIDGEEHWIPKSLIESSDPDPEDCLRWSNVELEIPEWFAEREGIEL